MGECECPECGKVLSSERGRDSHVEQVHGREYHDEQLLRELYVEQGLSSMDIAERFDVSDTTIRENLKRYGVKVRSTQESHRIKAPKELRNADKLRELYHNEGLTNAEIANRLGVTDSTVTMWRYRHGIEANDPPSGPDHYAWKENPDSIDYGNNWSTQRKAARDRDDDTCQICGKETNGRHLDVHHIRPIKSFDSPEDANTLDNLITLCRKCHREWEGIPLRPDSP